MHKFCGMILVIQWMIHSALIAMETVIRNIERNASMIEFLIIGSCSTSGVCTCSQSDASIYYMSSDCSIIDCGGSECGSASSYGTCVNYYPMSTC